MSRREKIIVALMVLAILGGGYDYFFSSNRKSFKFAKKNTQSLNKFVSEVVARLGKNDLVDANKYIIAKAEQKWKQDPFIQSETLLKSASQTESKKGIAKKIEFTYSGYINIGDNIIAVINSMEYGEGDNLQQDGYFVKGISPSRVIIGIIGEDNDIILPLQETD